MHILTILGSPRLGGNTAAALAEFEQTAGSAHTLERINLAGMTLNGCLGCDRCQESTDCPGCIQEDDLSAVIERIQRADAVVYASPVYCWGVSAQMKALFDRLYCLVKDEQPGSPALLKARAALQLMTCAGPQGNNADLPNEAFRREMDYLQVRCLGTFVIDRAQNPRQVGERAKATAGEMWAALQAAAQVSSPATAE